MGTEGNTKEKKDWVGSERGYGQRWRGKETELWRDEKGWT